MEENPELKNVKSMLRSVLMSCKEGVPAAILQRDYKEVVGEFLPFKKLGYSNLEDFILSIPDVVRVSKKGNEYIFNAVADESTAHIQKLVSKQRSKKVKKPVRRPRGGGRGGSSFMPRQPGLLTPRPPVYTPYVPNIPGQGRRGARNGMPSFMPQLVKALSPMMVHLNSGRGRMITIGNRSAPSNESFGEKPQSKFEMPPRFRHQKQPSGPQTKKPATDLQHVEDVEQYLQQLRSYLIDANLTAKFETTPAQGGFASSMVLNKRVYGSEGIFETAKEAEAAVARNILNSREINYQGSWMPIIDWDNPTSPISDWAEEVCKGDSSTDLSQGETIKVKTRIKEILTNKKNGLWATRIAFEYKEKYNNEEPPSDLVNLLKKWTDICKVELAPNTNMEIVYPVDESSGSKDVKIPKVDLLQSGVEAVVYVTYINNPGYFCIQKEDSIIEEISAKLEKHCKTANRPSQLEKGQFCAGVYSGDGHWFRAQVLDVNSQGKAQLLFVDFGNVEWVTIDAVRWLSPQLAEYPAQSVNCSLAGIIPLQNETEWSVEATKLMAKAVEDEALVAIPKCFYDNLVDVELFLKKNQTTSLNAFLVKKGVVRTIPTDVIDKPQPDILVLPEDNIWDVHVTYISSSLESVMVRIVGEEYSERLEKFMGTLETAFKESHSEAPIIEGVTYVAYDDGLYHRVRVLSQDEKRVVCYFLDHGDTDNLKPIQLQPLDPKIDCQLSYQAMEVCMFGLESVYTNITALEKMVDLAMGKTCVAEVIDRDIPSVVLYDTSGDSDININETILRTVKEEGGGIDSPRTSSPAPNSTSYSASSTSSTPRVLSPVPSGLARENDLNSNNHQQTGVGLSSVASMENLSTVPQQNNTDTQCNGNNKLLNDNNQMKSETLPSSYMPPPPPPKINQTISSEKLTSNNNKAETSLTDSIQSLSLAAGSPQAACGAGFSIGEAQSREPTCILKIYPVPNVGEYLDVHVICVNDPHSFMCIPYDEMNKFEGLLRKMLQFYTKNVELLHEQDIILGETYAGHKDSMWLRVKVTQQVSPGLYCAYQVDIGEFSVMELSELRPLDSAFCQLPIMAFQAKLGSLLPVEQRWSEASKYKLIQLALNKDLVGLVQGHNSATGVTDLKLIDTSNENYDICIDEVLIRLEYAKKASD